MLCGEGKYEQVARISEQRAVLPGSDMKAARRGDREEGRQVTAGAQPRHSIKSSARL